MENKKPLGIILIAIYSAFSGVLSLITSAGLLFLSAVPDMPIGILVLGMVLLFIGVFSLTATYGLWSIQPWGRNLARWLYLIFIPLGIISIFPIYPASEMTTANTLMQVTGVIIDIIIVWYLSKPGIGAIYSPQSEPQYVK